MEGQQIQTENYNMLAKGDLEISAADLELVWSINSSDWDILDGTKTTTNSFWGTVGAADVGGAVGTAATCWIVNAAPGAGQVAYGGAAVGSSVAVGVTILLTKWWGRLNRYKKS